MNVLRRLRRGLPPTTAEYAEQAAVRARQNDEADHWNAAKEAGLTAHQACRAYCGFTADAAEALEVAAAQTQKPMPRRRPKSQPPESRNSQPRVDALRRSRAPNTGMDDAARGTSRQEGHEVDRQQSDGSARPPEAEQGVYEAGSTVVTCNSPPVSKLFDGNQSPSSGYQRRPRSLPPRSSSRGPSARSGEQREHGTDEIDGNQPLSQMGQSGRGNEALRAREQGDEPVADEGHQQASGSPHEPNAAARRSAKAATTWLSRRPPPAEAQASRPGAAACTAHVAYHWTRRLAIGADWNSLPCARCSNAATARCRQCHGALCIKCAKAGARCIEGEA